MNDYLADFSWNEYPSTVGFAESYLIVKLLPEQLEILEENNKLLKQICNHLGIIASPAIAIPHTADTYDK